MAQAALGKSFAERIGWEGRIKPLLKTLVVAGIGLLVGLYILAPMQAARQPGHLPKTFLAMPAGAVQIANPDGSAGILPVRVADTSAARSVGFKGVGEGAMDNTFLLYVLTRETTGRASYAVEGFKVPVEFAAIDAEGKVVSVLEAPVGAERLSVAEKHRWLLAAEAGSFARFGIGVGSTIDPGTIRKF